jgi:hypothetical protein
MPNGTYGGVLYEPIFNANLLVYAIDYYIIICDKFTYYLYIALD